VTRDILHKLSRRFIPGRAALSALVSGALYALSFAPGPLPGWLLPIWQIALLAVLIRLCDQADASGQAARLGWLFGLSGFGTGLYWLFISLHTYGHLAAPLAAAGVAALAAALALFPALTCWTARRLSSGPVAKGSSTMGHALLWAAAWTLAEWLRGTLFTGMPWLNAGYAHADGPLAGWTPVLGVYGVAFLAAFAAAAISLLRRAGAPARRPAALTLIVALTGLGLKQIAWSTPHGEPLEVRLVQGNIDQGDKFDPARTQAGIVQHLEQAALPPVPGASEPRLIVLPETIMPSFQHRIAPEVWQAWHDLARSKNATVIMGAPLHDRRGRQTNSVIGITGATSLAELQSGDNRLRYDKRHLVPFGEFIPPGFRWFVNAMQIPLGDFDRGGERQPPFAVADQRVAPNICFEDVFGEELLPALHPGPDGAPGATILVNVSNLGWFGDSWALRQHLQIARVRAMETGRPMLRATNTGTTAAIAPNGRVLIQADPLAARVVGLPVQGMTGLTPYARLGNQPVLLFAALCLGIALSLQRSTKMLT